MVHTWLRVAHLRTENVIVIVIEWIGIGTVVGRHPGAVVGGVAGLVDAGLCISL
jgi:hypothetical protein